MTLPAALTLTHRVADAAVPHLRQAVLDAVGLARRRVDGVRVAVAWANGTVHGVLASIPWDLLGADLLGAVTPTLRRTLVDAALAHVPDLPVAKAHRHRAREAALAADLGLSFTQTNPRAVAWAEREAARLVTRVTGETRQAIREIVVRMFTDGMPPAEGARLIEAYLGLTPRDAVALDNLRRAWTADGVANVAERVARQAARYVRLRARTIARTESMAASNAGQRELWAQAMDVGALDPGAARQTWLLTPDELLCPNCAPVPAMNAAGVPLGGMFATPLGPVEGPILHPNCRCTTALVFADTAGDFQPPRQKIPLGVLR